LIFKLLSGLTVIEFDGIGEWHWRMALENGIGDKGTYKVRTYTGFGINKKK
jgi:hypothetical protein